MKPQEITSANLNDLHKILSERGVDYDLLSILPEFPAECLIQVGTEFMRKRAVHQLLGMEYFVISSETTSILRVLLVQIKDLKELENDNVALIKGAASIANFVLQTKFGLTEDKDFSFSLPISEINLLTKVIEIRLNEEGMAGSVYKKLEFLKLKYFLYVVLFEKTLHFVIHPEMAKMLDANIRNRHRKIIEYLKNSENYSFVVPNLGFGRRHLRINLGNPEKAELVTQSLSNEFPEYQFGVDGRIMTAYGVDSAAYRELFIRDRKSFSATTFLKNHSSKTPSIEEVLDLLYANSSVQWTKKKPKNRKNNMYVGFSSPDDAILGAKVLTSKGFICFWKEGSSTFSVPVAEEFGLWGEDKTDNPRKKHIEQKFNSYRDGY